MPGFKINWSKSALLHLNDSAKALVLPVNVPIVQQFKYLGIYIFSSLNQIVKYNYSLAPNKVMRDMDQWIGLPISIRVSIIKMNVLPRINFVSAMVPLPPSQDYWRKLQSATSKFISKFMLCCLLAHIRKQHSKPMDAQRCPFCQHV